MMDWGPSFYVNTELLSLCASLQNFLVILLSNKVLQSLHCPSLSLQHGAA